MTDLREEATQEAVEESRARSIGRETFEWVMVLSVAVCVALLLVHFVGRFTIVDGTSMQPTLENRSVLILERLTIQFAGVRQGEIVVMRIPELLEQHRSYAIKRVVATEGQHIVIQNGVVTIDGAVYDEPYIDRQPTLVGNDLYSDCVVPPGCIYVMGDNRLPDKSRDSRIFGVVKVERVVGRAWFRVFPFRSLGLLH